MLKGIVILLLLQLANTRIVWAEILDECIDIDNKNLTDIIFFSKFIIPELENTNKGDSGKIGVIGGSVEYTGAPYFAAITALKVGADLIYVITTENAAPIIKSYSPDLIVYPFLSHLFTRKISTLLYKMDLIVLGPGLGRESETIRLISEIIQTCKELKKPLVIDADGLYVITKNTSLIKNYPSPGVILTPNHLEQKRLQDAVGQNNSDWFKYWGRNVFVLSKGKEDIFHTTDTTLQWTLSKGGSGRRAGGQGDILSGSLGTFYNWALKANLCANDYSNKVAASAAAFAAAKFTRTCNSKAYGIYGRSMTASDMINLIPSSFQTLFSENSMLC